MNRTHPFYFKSTMILLGLVLLTLILYHLGSIIVPVVFSFLLAILLNPLSNMFQQWKLPLPWAILMSLLIAILVFIGIGYFIMSQLMNFSDQLPVLKEKSTELFGMFQQYLRTTFNVSLAKQNQWLGEVQADMKPLLGQALGSLLGLISVIFLVPVYTFLIMFYKTLVLNFLYEVFAEENSKEVHVLLGQTKSAIQSYMMGLLLEALAVATLNATALLILGVDYAILIGLIGAILNLLPYIGGLVGIALPLIMATITEDGYDTQVWIFISYLIIQFIDNNFLVPYIVSSKIKINALVSIVVVLMGGAIWGVAGMFLSIPIIGILKLIFDRIPELKPWGKLLGDEVPLHHKGEIWLFRRSRRIKQEKEAEATEKSS